MKRYNFNLDRHKANNDKFQLNLISSHFDISFVVYTVYNK